MNELRQRLGQQIRELRKDRGLTQEQLAERADVHVTFLSRVESGRVLPGLDVLDRLARALGLTLGELLGPLHDEPREVRAERLLQEIQAHLAECSPAELRLVRDFVALLRRGRYGLRDV